MKLEIKKIGNSTGLILPRELLARANFSQGDWVTVSEMPDGTLSIRRSDPVFDKGLEIAERAMVTYRNALEELAEVNEPIWLPLELVLAIHARQLNQFGGPPGVREFGMLESALGRARHRWEYEQGDLAALAGAYGFGIARNHPFVDGNKRAALLSVVAFLGLNGIDFLVDEAEFTVIIRDMAAGLVDEAGLVRWIRDNLPKPKPQPRRK